MWSSCLSGAPQGGRAHGPRARGAAAATGAAPLRAGKEKQLEKRPRHGAWVCTFSLLFSWFDPFKKFSCTIKYIPLKVRKFIFGVPIRSQGENQIQKKIRVKSIVFAFVVLDFKGPMCQIFKVAHRFILRPLSGWLL